MYTLYITYGLAIVEVAVHLISVYLANGTISVPISLIKWMPYIFLPCSLFLMQISFIYIETCILAKLKDLETGLIIIPTPFNSSV